MPLAESKLLWFFKRPFPGFFHQVLFTVVTVIVCVSEICPLSNHITGKPPGSIDVFKVSLPQVCLTVVACF